MHFAKLDFTGHKNIDPFFHSLMFFVVFFLNQQWAMWLVLLISILKWEQTSSFPHCGWRNSILLLFVPLKAPFTLCLLVSSSTVSSRHSFSLVCVGTLKAWAVLPGRPAEEALWLTLMVKSLLVNTLFHMHTNMHTHTLCQLTLLPLSQRKQKASIECGWRSGQV